MEIQIDPHTLERAEERGLQEITDADAIIHFLYLLFLTSP